MSLNLKLIGITLVAFIVIISLVTFKEYQTIRTQVLQHKQDSILRSASHLKDLLIASMLKNEAHDVRMFFQHRSYKQQSSAIHLLIFNPEDRRITISMQPDEQGKNLNQEHYNLYEKHGPDSPFFLEDNGALSIAVFEEIENSHACHTCHPRDKRILGIIFKQNSLDRELAGVRRIILDHIIFSFLALVFFGCSFSYVVFKLIDDPLEKIMETIKFIEQGDLGKRVDIQSTDIIGILASKFNAMTEKIEENRNELAELHRKQMERSSELALIGEISSGIAHEVKNPLACISSALQIIERETAPESENRLVIQEVLNQVNRLDHVVKRILEFARPTKAPKTIFDVDKVLQSTFLFINNYAMQRGCAVEIAHGDGVRKILADAQALRQILLNICLNGIEAMQPKGSLTITTGTSLRSGANYCEIKISDRGTGIPPEYLPLIFDPFFTTKEKGTGLGLAISMKLVEEHHGFIEVDSMPGEGTTFRVYFPLVEEV